MVSTFRIGGYHTQESIHLKLPGDQDGSSALELIQRLVKGNPARRRVFIRASGLESANTVAYGIPRLRLPSLPRD